MPTHRTALIAVSTAIDAALAPGAPPDTLRLEPRQPVTRAIRPGEVHRYSVEAATGALVRGSVRQDGVAVNVRGFFPDGSTIRSFADGLIALIGPRVAPASR